MMEELKILLESGIETNVKKALSLAKGKELLETVAPPYLKLNQWLQQFDRGEGQEASVEEIIHHIAVVQYLDITDKELETLPNDIFHLMGGLLTINLSNNKLSELPDSIASLTHLNSLELSYNNFVQLNKHIGGLQQLNYLYLNDNNIKELPDSIGDLKELRELYLTHNPLLQLPTTVHQLSKLKHLDMEDNMDDDYNVVSEEEQRRIEQSLPNCQITF